MQIRKVGVGFVAAMLFSARLASAQGEQPLSMPSSLPIVLPMAVAQSDPQLPQDDYIVKRISTAQRWEIRTGKSVALFYVKGEENTPQTVQQKLDALEDVLEQERALLGFKPLPFLVPVYLFPSAQAHGKVFGIKTFDGVLSQYKTLTGVDCGASRLKQNTAYGFVQLLLNNQSKNFLPYFLEVGVANWTRMTLREQFPVARTKDNIRSPLLLGVTTDKPLKSVCGMNYGAMRKERLYLHATSFIEYLISTGENRAAGLQRLQAFLQEVIAAKGKPEERMRTACLVVLGKDLEAAEKEWRIYAPNWLDGKGWLPTFQNLDFAQGQFGWESMGKADMAVQYQPQDGVLDLTLAHDPKSENEVEGHLAQWATLGNYRGKRLQISLTVESLEGEGTAVFSFQCNQKKQGARTEVPLNPTTKAGKSATYTMVVDIPVDVVEGGLMISATGPVHLRLKGFTVLEVGTDVPATPIKERRSFDK